MALKIKSFGMTKMTVGSCSDFHDKVVGFINTATPAALHIEDKSEAYVTATNNLAAVVKRQEAYVSTEALVAADKLRDRTAGTINSVIKAYLTTTVAEKQAAAKLLYPQLSPYKGIGDHEYTKQTAEVKGMHGVLTAEGNKAAVTLLGLDDETAMLLKTNQDFEKIMLQRAAEANQRAIINDAKSEDLMDEANKQYEGIVEIVNAYAVVSPTETINTFIHNVNGLVELYSDKAGSSTGEAGKPEEEKPEDGQPSVDDGDDEEEDRPQVQ